MLWQILLVAIVGAVGTLARYGLGTLVHSLCGSSFPWGTLVVNVLGCFLFGLLWTLAEDRAIISARTRLIMLTGFMGAFTTFSTYAFETCDFLRASQWWLASCNFLAQNVLGIAAIAGGWALGRLL